MKAILIILSIFCLLGCRTKITKKEKIKSEEYSEMKFEKKLDSLVQKKEEKKESKKTEISNQKKESESNIEIKGKSETGKPLEIFDIENGDTLQVLKVIGNAEVFMKTKRSNSEIKKAEKSESEYQNVLEKVSRAVVKEENLKKAGTEINKKAKDLKVTDTSTGIYITVISLGAVAIVMFFIFMYFKKK